MMKSLKNMLRQDKEAYKVPRSVHDYIPITAVYEDGIFKVGGRYTKSFRFDDINYLVAGKEDRAKMFLAYSEILNSLDSNALTKITISNRKRNREDFEKNILMPIKDDDLDSYREEYNDMLRRKASDANNNVQEKYLTVSISNTIKRSTRSVSLKHTKCLNCNMGTFNGKKCCRFILPKHR